MLPKFLEKYFWDVSFKKLDAKRHPHYLIERILEYGDEKAARWMLENFTKSQIKKTLLGKRGLSARSANYWALMLNIPKNKILCLKKSYQKMRAMHWLY